MFLAVLASVSAAFASDGGSFKQVKPKIFDPHHTFLVQSTWLSGIGCPTNATTVDFDILGNLQPPATFSDPACMTGDSKDKRNQGLLLAKTGHTANDAAATARLEDVPKQITELGYDLRKPSSAGDFRGSHCGAGAPRFNVVTSDNMTHFVGCNSPAAMMTPTTSNGWIRLRWGPTQLAAAFPPIAPSDQVKQINIIFDESEDTGPDNFGVAILDNIDVNSTLVGQGPTSSDQEHDRPKDKKDNNNNN
jgi:hypothetical protein